MSRSKKLCCLLGLLAAVCGATLILLQVEEQKEKIKNSEDVILELPWESVTALSWEWDGGGSVLPQGRDLALRWR